MMTQGTVNAKIKGKNLAGTSKKGNKKPALSSRAKNNMERALPSSESRRTVHLVGTQK